MIGENYGRYEGVISFKKFIAENRRGEPMCFLDVCQKFEINPVSGKFHPLRSKIFPKFFASGELATEMYDELEPGDFVRIDFSLSSYTQKRAGGTVTTCRVQGYQKLPHPSGDKDVEKMKAEEWMHLVESEPPGPWKGNTVFGDDRVD